MSYSSYELYQMSYSGANSSCAFNAPRVPCIVGMGQLMLKAQSTFRGPAFKRGKCENARHEWAKRRAGKSLSHVHRAGGEDEFAGRMMREYLQQEGRLHREEGD
jgi:hypothetical protein